MMDAASSLQLENADQTKATPDQAAKIRRDLDVVQNNMAVFSEMLSEMKPGSETASDVELLQELYTTCKEMQRRVAELLCTIASDELTAELLHINDELNNLFLRYGRYKKNQEKTQQKPTEKSLIDFGSESAGGEGGVSTKLGGLSLGGTSGKASEDDFDSFAQSRNQTDKSASKFNAAKAAEAAGTNTEEEILMLHKPSDFDEMEAWLRENPGAAGAHGEESTLTSSEFDKFLADRAAVSAAANNSTTTTSSAPSDGRNNSKVAL